MNKVYLLFGLLSSAAIFAPDVRADISLPSEKITFVHTLHTHLFSEVYLSPPSFSERQEIKVAQVCWITDTDDCGGADFVGTDGMTGTPPEILPPGGDGGDDGGDYKESCAQMGYDKTSCPEGYSPDKFCPLDEKYFAECVQDCPSDYNKCEPPLQGVGDPCGDDLYKDCCNPTCPPEYKYDEDNVPDGYELSGEPCMECDEGGSKIKPKYKDIIEIDCTGYLDCGDMGCEDGATTCQSGETILCSECKKCPNLGTETDCPPCTVCTYEECSNLYIVTGCATGCTDWCAFNCANMGYKQQTCANTYVKCPIDTSYVYCLGN